MAVCTVGILLRVAMWARGFPLRQNEAALAMNVLERGISGLLDPLAYGQAAPWGFLVATEGLASIFGPSEIVLRTLPLLASCVALVAFVSWVSDRFGLSLGLLGALAILAFTPPIVLHAANFKPYSVDLLVTVGLLMIWGRCGVGWPLALAATLAPWLSFPSVFVLAGLGIVELTHTNWRIVGVGVASLASLGLYYVLSLSGTASSSYLLDFWADSFAPGPVELLPWIGRTVTSTFVRPIWILGAPIAGALSVVGFYRLTRREPDLALLLAGVFTSLLMASAFQLYPVRGRLLMFAAPFILLSFGLGLDVVLEAGRAGRLLGRPYLAGATGGALIGAVMLIIMWQPRRSPYPILEALDGRKAPSTVQSYHNSWATLSYYTARTDRHYTWVHRLPAAAPDTGWMVWSPGWFDVRPKLRVAFMDSLSSVRICDAMAGGGFVAYRVCPTTP